MLDMEAVIPGPRRRGRPANDPGHASGFAARIRDRRRVLGLKQCDLAARVGVGKSSVSDWESGLKVPAPRHVPALCRALDWTPNDIFGWEEESPS